MNHEVTLRVTNEISNFESNLGTNGKIPKSLSLTSHISTMILSKSGKVPIIE